MNEPRTPRWIVPAILLLVLLLGVCGAARTFGEDPALARVRQLRGELTSEAVRNLPPEERRERWRQFGEQVKQLSPQQRDQLDEDRRRAYHEQLERYFALPRAQQVAHLDKEIDRMQAARKRWEAAQAQRAVAGNAPGPPAGRGPSAPGAGAPGGGGGRPAPSAEEREKRRKDWLDRTTPEQRARMAEYRKQLEARRKERGLPPSPWPGR